MDIKDFLSQYVKPQALRLGGEVAVQEVEGGSGGTIPSTAKLYFPDVEGILDDIFYILENEPISATDSVWGNFIDANVNDLTNFISAQDFLNKGIYEENDYMAGESEDTDVRNIGYSGVTNFGVFDEGPADYSGANYYFVASFEDDTYDNIDSFCNISVKGDIEIGYNFDKTDNTAIETSIYFQNIPATNLAISFGVIVDNSGVEPTLATYSLQVFGSNN
jgi:hypothetical protein